VDSEIPIDGIYQNINLSNFFNRESGGDGSGNLGTFQVIGDVYYITTDGNKSEYVNDQAVNNHVIAKINSLGINFRQYDNWEFLVGGEFYMHDYRPYNPSTGLGGDGELDYAFIFWRELSKDYTTAGGYKSLNITSFTTHDGVIIKSESGSTQFNLFSKGGEFGTSTNRAITAPAHEYTHYLLGGNNTTGHWDGEVMYGNGGPAANVGMISRFALMTGSENYSYCALEKYLLGWLEPRVVSTNNFYTTLYDTHVNNDAIMVPIRYDASGRLAEYYFIENFQTINSYSGANPFKTTNLFNYTFSNGVLVYHIEEMAFDIYTKSKVDIECSDGLWNWGLSQGTSTPNDRTDDKLVKLTPNRNNGLDERDFIPLTVGSVYWDDYMPLTPASIGAALLGTNHGRRFDHDDWLGDKDDFYGMESERVFTSWSNPSTVKYDGTLSNFGFEISSYIASQHKYILKLGFDSNALQGFIPSKPQNLKVISDGDNPVLTWERNIEPDVTGSQAYGVFRNGTFIAFVAQTAVGTNPSYSDNEIYWEGYDWGTWGINCTYEVKAKDVTNKISLPSEAVSLSVDPNNSGYLNKNNADSTKNLIAKNIEYFELSSNYPNPFNPTTQISYQLPENSFVNLVVYNVIGQKVAELVNQEQTSGKYTVKFDARNLPSGVYIYKLQAGEFSDVKKMLLTK